MSSLWQGQAHGCHWCCDQHIPALGGTSELALVVIVCSFQEFLAYFFAYFWLHSKSCLWTTKRTWGLRDMASKYASLEIIAESTEKGSWQIPVVINDCWCSLSNTKGEIEPWQVKATLFASAKGPKPFYFQPIQISTAPHSTVHKVHGRPERLLKYPKSVSEQRTRVEPARICIKLNANCMDIISWYL